MVKKVIPRRYSFIGGGVGYGYGVCPYRCMTSIFMREDVRPTFQAVVGTTSMVGVGTEVGTEEGGAWEAGRQEVGSSEVGWEEGLSS